MQKLDIIIFENTEQQGTEKNTKQVDLIVFIVILLFGLFL